MGVKEIHIASDICKGCGLCVLYCPQDVLRVSSRPNKTGYRVIEVGHLQNCAGCRLCELNCPDLAIYVDIQ